MRPDSEAPGYAGRSIQHELPQELANKEGITHGAVFRSHKNLHASVSARCCHRKHDGGVASLGCGPGRPAASAQRRQGAGQLASPSSELRGTPVLQSEGGQPRQREEPEGRVDHASRRHRGRRHLEPWRPGRHPYRRERLSLRHRWLGVGLQDRCAWRPRRAGLEDGSEDGP